MTGEPHQAAPVDVDEHYVVSLEAFNALHHVAEALIGIAQITDGGRIGDGQPEVSRAELGAIFRTFGQQLGGHLRALPHRPSRGA